MTIKKYPNPVLQTTQPSVDIFHTVAVVLVPSNVRVTVPTLAESGGTSDGGNGGHADGDGSGAIAKTVLVDYSRVRGGGCAQPDGSSAGEGTMEWIRAG